MTTAAKVAVVMLTTLTLAPMQSRAACAWVLWLTSWDDKTKEYQYRYRGAYSTKSECDDDAAFRNRNIKRESDRDPSLYIGVLTCVPDTIDPREKGATR